VKHSHNDLLKETLHLVSIGGFMKYSIYLWLVILTTLLTPAISTASQIQLTTYREDFQVGPARGNRVPFPVEAGQAGCILARVQSWPPATSGSRPVKVTLILNGSDRTGYYARSDGDTADPLPLWTSYAVSAREAGLVDEWTLSVINFTEGSTAEGTIQIEFPPSQTPCQFEANVPRTMGVIDLSWHYTSPIQSDYFFVERSMPGTSSWSPVSDCRQRVDARSSDQYFCSDTGLRSKTSYTYRACWVASSSSRQCGTSNVTPAVSAKAP
jgi:hypothetical protein